jgi:phospholipase D-like protein
VIAVDYPFADVLGTMLVFFGFVVWLWLLIRVFADVFRPHDIGGWAKFFWCLLVLVVPLVGVLVYLIVQGKEIGERDMAEAQVRKAEFDAYVRETAGNSVPASEIAHAKQLLDSGAISQTEFDSIKAKALA